MTRNIYLWTLVGFLTVLWIAAAIQPFDRSDWLLENILTVAAIALLAGTHRAFPLSKVSYTTIFVFLCLHTTGSHWTYAEVPYDEAWRNLTGYSLDSALGWERNNYDRVVHFAYGLLLAYPIREVFLRIANVRGFWGYFLPLDLTMSTSALYELIEWGAALVVGVELGQAYLGTQGDVWDAHKDMALAALGALIAMCVTAGINVYLQRDFAHEWIESLRVHGREPLGEVAIRQMLDQKGSA
jgi:putative membrane protein